MVDSLALGVLYISWEIYDLSFDFISNSWAILAMHIYASLVEVISLESLKKKTVKKRI